MRVWIHEKHAGAGGGAVRCVSLKEGSVIKKSGWLNAADLKGLKV